MFDISNNNIITITRGDVAETYLYINLGTALEPIYFDANVWPQAIVYVGIMEPNEPFEHAIVKKTFRASDEEAFIAGEDPNRRDTLVLKFQSKDTINLVPGTYYYSVKL